VFLVVALFALMAVGLYAQTEADFGVYKSKDGKSVIIEEYNGKATAVNIPAKIQNLPVTEIGEEAFSKKSSITSVTIPSGVTSIGVGAFNNCNSLTNVTIPSSVKTIGSRAFYACTKLTSITIPASVTIIENSVFSDCYGLTSITIPASVTKISSEAFNFCRELTSVTFGGTIPSSGFHANAFKMLGDIRDKYLAAGGGAGTYTRPAGGETWTKGGSTAAVPAYDGTPGLEFKLNSDGKSYSVSGGTAARPGGKETIVIPATYNNLPVTTVPNSAFREGIMVTSLTIPASVTVIDTLGFTSCVGLKSVTFGGANTRFGGAEFPDGVDLLNKYKAGGAGTYTRDSQSKTWTKK
jgi:hypothetical protein